MATQIITSCSNGRIYGFNKLLLKQQYFLCLRDYSQSDYSQLICCSCQTEIETDADLVSQSELAEKLFGVNVPSFGSNHIL